MARPTGSPPSMLISAHTTVADRSAIAPNFALIVEGARFKCRAIMRSEQPAARPFPIHSRSAHSTLDSRGDARWLNASLRSDHVVNAGPARR